MSRNRRTKSYPPEFRVKAVRLATVSGYTVEDVAKEESVATRLYFYPALA